MSESQFSESELKTLKRILGNYHRDKGISNKESEDAYLLYQKVVLLLDATKKFIK